MCNSGTGTTCSYETTKKSMNVVVQKLFRSCYDSNEIKCGYVAWRNDD